MPLYTLSNYSTLLEVALEKGKIQQADMELLAFLESQSFCVRCLNKILLKPSAGYRTSGAALGANLDIR